MGESNNRGRWVRTWLRIGGKDYSVYNPGKVRQGLRLWVKALRKVLPRQQGSDDANDGGSGS